MGEINEGNVLRGRYEVVRVLGRSQYASVCLVKDRVQNRDRIVKLLQFPEGREDPSRLSDWCENEANILERLNHHSLPKVVDHFTEEGRFCLVREFVEGRTLDVLLCQQEKPLTEAQLRGWMGQILETFEYLHSRQPPVVFGGLRLKNLIVTPLGKVRIMDFGISRFFPPGLQKDLLAPMAAGFVAPEQLEGKSPDERSDIYTLGAISYSLLTGRSPAEVPFVFEPVKGEKTAFVEQAEPVIRKAMEKEPDARFASVAELKMALLGGKSGREQPRMMVDVEQIELLDLPRKRTVSGNIMVRNVGGGSLVGRAWADVDWLTVYPDVFTGNEVPISFSIRTADAAEGVLEQGHILLESRTEKKEVPVSFSVSLGKGLRIGGWAATLVFMILPVIWWLVLYLFYGSMVSIYEAALAKSRASIVYGLRFCHFLFLLYPWLCPLLLSVLFYGQPRNMRGRHFPVYCLSLFLPSVLFIVQQRMSVPALMSLVPAFLLINLLSVALYILPGIEPFVVWYRSKPGLRQFLEEHIMTGIIVLLYAVLLVCLLSFGAW